MCSARLFKSFEGYACLHQNLDLSKLKGYFKQIWTPTGIPDGMYGALITVSTVGAVS